MSVVLLTRRRDVLRAAGSPVGDFFAVAHTSFDLDNDSGVAALADGDQIGSLADQTGNARTASQATATRRPLRQTVNGRLVARFDGTDDDIATAVFADVAQPNTVVGLLKYDDADTTTRYALSGVESTKRHALLTTSGRFAIYAGALLSNELTGDDANWHVVVAEFNGASSRIYLDGGAAKLTGDAGTQTVTGVTLGNFMPSGTTPWDGDHNFYGLYPGLLRIDNLALLNSLGQELAGRMGIAWTNIT